MNPAIVHVLKYFQCDHLPEHLQAMSKPFARLAQEVACSAPNNPETTIALRKLLEAKDAAVRASLAAAICQPDGDCGEGCEEAAEEAPASIYRRRIETDEIVLRSRDGKHSIVLCAKEDSVGIWVSHGQDSVCIYSGSNVGPGPYVGVIHPDNRGCPVAISIHQGDAQIQLSDGENIKSFSPKELLELAKR